MPSYFLLDYAEQKFCFQSALLKSRVMRIVRCTATSDRKQHLLIVLLLANTKNPDIVEHVHRVHTYNWIQLYLTKFLCEGLLR
jgi:hypothetical protein